MIEAILNYDFMKYSFISGIIVGLIAPLLGTFIVVRRLSLIADALSHVALGGIAFGVYLTSIFNVVINPVISGVVFSVIGALGIEKLRGLYKHYSEIAIPIIMSLGIALSVLFLSLANGFNQDLFGYLFGSISAVSFSDLILISIIGAIVILFVFFLYKEMFFISFDEEYAGVMKLSKYIHIIYYPCCASNQCIDAHRRHTAGQCNDDTAGCKCDENHFKFQAAYDCQHNFWRNFSNSGSVPRVPSEHITRRYDSTCIYRYIIMYAGIKSCRSG